MKILAHPFENIFGYYDACSSLFYFRFRLHFRFPYIFTPSTVTSLAAICLCFIFVLLVFRCSRAHYGIFHFGALMNNYVVLFCALSTWRGANLSAFTIFNLHANGGKHFPSHLVVDCFPFWLLQLLYSNFWCSGSLFSWPSEAVVSVSPIK